VEIAYATRSQFLPAFESAVHEHRAELLAGGVVRVDLPEGGYDGGSSSQFAPPISCSSVQIGRGPIQHGSRRGSKRLPPRCGTAAAVAGLRSRIRAAR
jgi:hypothetical protein